VRLVAQHREPLRTRRAEQHRTGFEPLRELAICWNHRRRRPRCLRRCRPHPHEEQPLPTRTPEVLWVGVGCASPGQATVRVVPPIEHEGEDGGPAMATKAMASVMRSIGSPLSIAPIVAATSQGSKARAHRSTSTFHRTAAATATTRSTTLLHSPCRDPRISKAPAWLAAERGYRVRYTLATKLVNELVEGRRRQATGQDDRKVRPRRPPHDRRARLHGTRPARRRAPLPCPHRARGEELHRDRLQPVLLRLDRHLHRPRLCAAIVDRLSHHGTIIETGTHSYRLAHARSTRG
jgi:hypothetical protein